MNVFLGITGASGAPYAARLLDMLIAADVEVGLCASSAGLEVVATELYGDPDLDRDEVLRRFVGERAGVTVHAPNDWRAPYASGSAKVDAYVICPCSMGTAGTIASGTMTNLIHRAASVAIKEGRKLVVVVPRTPSFVEPPTRTVSGPIEIGAAPARPDAGRSLTSRCFHSVMVPLFVGTVHQRVDCGVVPSEPPTA